VNESLTPHASAGAALAENAGGAAGGGPIAEDRGRRALLGYRGAIALVIANTIGTGVFTTSGFALADLGEPAFVMLAWLVGGVYALAGVTVYADLAIKYPESGGEYAFLRNTLHPALGTVAGWISLVAGFTAPIAAAALGAELYLSRALGVSHGLPWIATAVVFILGLLHAAVPEKGVRFQNAAVLVKVSAIVFFIAFGAPTAVGQLVRAPMPAAGSFSLLAFGGSLVWISYAYSGWNAAVYVTGEVAGGGSTVKRALYAGAVLVIALYIGVSAVILYSASQEQLRGVAESGAVAARALGGARAEQALSGLIALALVTSASSMLLAGPRVYARMSRDGVLPAILGRLHGDHPRIAILAQMALSLLLVWIAGLRDLLEFVGVTLSLSAGAAVVGWLHEELLSSSPSRRAFEVCAAVFFLLATLGIAIAALVMRPTSALASVGLIGCGFLAHIWGRHCKCEIRPQARST
jgi:APA family basic amino acid/polyamine antiporter